MSDRGRSRAAVLSLVMAISACGGGGSGGESGSSGSPNGGSAPPPSPPVISGPISAKSDMLRADGASLNAIDVQANDTIPGRSRAPITIETPSDVGTVTANSDGSIKLTDLPARFRGVTHFSYKITSTTGESSITNAAIFVGVDPFRVMFVADTSDKVSGGEEIFVSNLADPAVKLTSASRDGYVIRGYVAAPNGRTVVYRRDLANTWLPREFWYFSDFAAAGEHRIELPAGFKPHSASNPVMLEQLQQFIVSPDGKWIAVVADSTDPSLFTPQVFLLNVADPTATLTPLRPTSATWIENLQFSPSSKYLYFTAAGETYDSAVFRVAMAAPATPAEALTVLQLTPPPADPDDYETMGYRLNPDDSNIYVFRSSLTHSRLSFVETATPGIEYPLFPESVRTGERFDFAEVIDRPDSGLGSTHLIFGTGRTTNPATNTSAYRIYSADLARSLSPQLLLDSRFPLGTLRPDEKAMLSMPADLHSYDPRVLPDQTAMYEVPFDGSGPPIKINGDTLNDYEADYLYDDTGDTILVRRTQEVPLYRNYFRFMDVAFRESFGTLTRLNKPNYFSRVASIAGTSRGVTVMTEEPMAAGPSFTGQLVLINLRAPDKRIVLSTHVIPPGMRSNVVTFLQAAQPVP